MDNSVKFGNREATCILIVLINTKIFLTFLRIISETAGTAGWILALYISIVVLISFFIISKLYDRFERQDLLDIAEYIAGGAGRIVVGVPLALFFVYTCSTTLRDFSENIKTISLVTSPMSYVIGFFVICMVISAAIGIEAVARIHLLLVPIITVSYLFILIWVTQYFDITNILPVFGNGAYDIFVKGFARVSVYSELVAVFLLVPFVKSNKNIKSIGYKAIFFSMFVMTAGSLVYMAVMPYPISNESFLPIYRLARAINYGRFFERVESLFLIMWTMSALLYFSTTFYFSIHVFKKAFKLTYYKTLILPFSIIIFTVSFMPHSLMANERIEIVYFRNFTGVTIFLSVLVLLIVARVKRRIKGGSSA